MLNQLEILWFQKSRVEAIRDGDRNTRYYHTSTVVRRCINRIEAPQDIHGLWLYSTDELKRMVRDYFQSLYTDDGGPYQPFSLPRGLFPTLTLAEKRALEKSFLVSAVHKAIFGMDAYKAPGPDGTRALFYQRLWDLAGPQLSQLALNVLDGGEFPEKLNETFLVLIPKVENPQIVTQLRPIGLCNVAYKTITKMIVNRLKPILSKLVAPTQSSFVPGRQISNNIIIVQEILHTMRRKKGRKGFMAIKLDLEKA